MSRRATIDVDVAIIGAGVVGCAVAARLSASRLRVCVIERRHDVADETSKSNTAIADSGWDCTPGTLEAELVRRASPRWEEICDRLDVPFRRCGGLSLALTAEDERGLEGIVTQAARNGVKARRLDANAVRRTAPYVTTAVRGAVEIPDEGIIDSIRLTLAYAELAALNGVIFHCGEPLVGAVVRARRVRELHTPRVTVRPRFVVNAAGLGADVVSQLLDGEEFSVWPRRGEYLILDRDAIPTIDRVVTQLPTEYTRGVMVVPTTHGSVLLGPTAADDDNKTDRSTHASVLERIMDETMRLVPEIRADDVIKSFAGLRPASERTYRIEQSSASENLIQACGIRSTGVSASYAIAEHVEEVLQDASLGAKPRKGAIERLPRRLRLRNQEDLESLAAHPLGRTVVCACEKVTALEIHDAFRSPVPARSVAGVAKRTRATWGRCQGAACLAGVCFITSLYLDCPAHAIPQSEPGSTLGVSNAHA